MVNSTDYKTPRYNNTYTLPQSPMTTSLSLSGSYSLSPSPETPSVNVNEFLTAAGMNIKVFCIDAPYHLVKCIHVSEETAAFIFRVDYVDTASSSHCWYPSN